MTTAEAYGVLGVNPICNITEIEKTYIKKFNELRLQAQYGNLITVRNTAQQKMAQLKDAFEHLKKQHMQIPARAAAVPQGFPQPFLIPPAQHVNTAARGPGANPRGALPLSNRHVAASFIIAGLMMLVVILFSISASGSFKPKPIASLRVLSVPWCYVAIDGKRLGESGQPEAFKVSEGTHELKLWMNNKVLTRRIELKEGSNVVVKAQFDKGTVNVGEQKLI
jgi:hypothetical protein